MRTTRTLIGASLMILMVASLCVQSPAWAATHPPAMDQPTARAATVTVNLCAKAGTVTMPDSAIVPIWGFADCANPAQIPGPTLIATEGDTLVVNLTNQVPGVNVSILFEGQDAAPAADVIGVASGSSRTYTINDVQPGTYLYESGVTQNNQVSMGLYGALVVNSTTANQAYDDPATAYGRDKALVLSELDPALNANPANFNLVDYHPMYWLINGQPYPQQQSITATLGSTVLLRYVNAGLDSHVMTLLGGRQHVYAEDGNPLIARRDAAAQLIPPGQTCDAFVDFNSILPSPVRWPVYERNGHLANVNASPGGMLVFIEEPISATLDLPLLAKNASIVSGPNGVSVGTSVEQPADEQLVEKPVDQPPDEPVVVPDEQPVEQPTAETVVTEPAAPAVEAPVVDQPAVDQSAQ